MKTSKRCVALFAGLALAGSTVIGTSAAHGAASGVGPVAATSDGTDTTVVATGSSRGRTKVSASFKRNRLIVTGTSSSDRIKVLRTRNTLVVRVGSVAIAVQPRPLPRQVKSVQVRARGGDDVVKIKDSSALFPRTTVQGGGGSDRLVGSRGETVLLGRRGADTLVSGGGRTTIVGDDGDDRLVGGQKLNTMAGGDGADTITGGSGSNAIQGGNGNDTIIGGAGDSSANGGEGNDTLLGGAGKSDFVGGNGDDTLTGGVGPSRLFGAASNDIVQAGAGASRISGGGGNDILTGGPATDQYIGESGDDTLVQSPGSDELSGGDGNDQYLLDADLPGGAVQVNEAAGAGIDLLSFAASSTVPITMDLGAGGLQPQSPSLQVRVSSGQVEQIVGGSLSDTLTGSTAANQLTGGAGADTFRHRGPGDGVDSVVDFNAAAGDRVGFVGGVVASQLDLDATGTRLRDVASATFGFNFPGSVYSSATPVFGATTTSPTPSPLVAWSGAGDQSVGGDTGGLLTSLTANGVVLSGGADRDRIVDLSGNANTLVGAAGDDTLVGGPGPDTFRYDGSGPLGGDTIADFSGDRVQLTNGATVSGGFGTTTVTLSNGGTTLGTITSGNGRAWTAGDFV